VVVGQFLGIGILVLASAIVGAAALVVPDGYTARLGAVPLALGFRKLWQRWGERRR
jgi:cadmium resistance protein CadD (predicted permease)